MAVQYEDRLLDYDYVEIQVKSLPEIRKNLYGYTIKYSDNFIKGSNSIYVTFTHQISTGYVVSGTTLRISDHLAKGWDGETFMINPKIILTSKKKQALIKALNKTLQKSKMRIRMYCLKRSESREDK